MPTPATPSLSSIVESQGNPAAQVAPVKPTAIPSLQDAIDSTSPTASQPSAATPAPGITPIPEASSPAAAETQSQIALRDLLVKRGLSIPDDLMTDDQIADALVDEFDAAVSSRQSPEFQKYLAWQAQQSSLAAQPQPKSEPAIAQVAERDLLNAIRSGTIAFDGESKKWVAAYPQFADYAQAMNDQDARSTQSKIKLAADPEAFIRQQIQESIASLKPQGETAELKELLQQIRQERHDAQVNQVDAWVSENAAKLFVAGTKTLTPLGELYETIESSVDAKLGPLERHKEVLKKWSAFDKAFSPKPATPEPQPAAAPQPKPSFLDAAARRGGVNRLSEYSGPASNPVSPQVPRGKNGLPSLNALIEQQTSLTNN